MRPKNLDPVVISEQQFDKETTHITDFTYV